MTMRFVLEESSWAAAAQAGIGVLSEAVHQLLDRLDVARERGEGVVKHADYYETDLGDEVRLFSILFEQDCRMQLDHDLAERLMRALDQVNQFDDADLPEYDAEFEGRVRFAPGAVWAHTRCSEGRQMAVLPLPLGDHCMGGYLLPWLTLPLRFLCGRRISPYCFLSGGHRAGECG